MVRRLGSSRKLVAAGVAAAVALSTTAAVAQTDAKIYPSWSFGPLQKTPSVRVRPIVAGKFKMPKRPITVTPKQTVWPTPGTVTVPVGSKPPSASNALATFGVAPAGGFTAGELNTPDARASTKRVAAAPRPTAVSVRTAAHNEATAAGVSGTVWSLSAATPTGASASAAEVATSRGVSVSVSYAGFVDAYGGDYGSRLRLVQLPGCALTTPAKAACRTQTPIAASVNDLAHQRLAADLLLPAASGAASQTTPAKTMVIAATAAPNGGGGDFRATSLATSGSWSVGNTGAFDYTYPITTPPTLGGDAPTVSLGYDSASVDGRTSATNSQASWVGDGWDYSPGFLERTYKSCTDDGVTGSGDECWSGDNATVSLNGHSSRLVPTSVGGTQWRLQGDDGSVVDEISVASTSAFWNGLNAGTYWRLTTNDGTQYFFGANHLPASVGGKGTDASTNAAWGVPVFGDDASEPCHSSSFNASSCTQGYRWNLDFVVDPHTNTTVYHYATDTTGGYEAGTGTAAQHTFRSYTRAGNVTSLTYGQLAADYVSGQKPAAEVDFATTGRCDGLSGFSCATAISTSNASHFPDVPYDQYCASATNCTTYSPTFWTTRALSSISTKVWDQSLSTPAWSAVDSYALSAPSFPAAGDASPTGGPAKPALWLSSITHTGTDTRGGGAAVPALSPTTFDGAPLPNRVQGLNVDNVPPINRRRINTITSETGAQTVVNYRTDQSCNRDAPPTEDNDTSVCYPVRWTPADRTDPILDWFYTYPVTEVDQNDNHAVWGGAASPSHVTQYAYSGAAWHRDDSEYTPTNERTWNQFAGYRQVSTTTGSGSDAITKKVDQYLQGMNGDVRANGATRSVVELTDSGDSVTDRPEWVGTLLQSAVWSSASGSPQSETIQIPWTSAVTATQARAGLPDLIARFSGVQRVDNRALLASGLWRTSRTNSTFSSSTGLTATVDNLGEIDASGTSTAGGTTPESCTSTTYASDASRNMVSLPAQVLVEAGGCTSTPDANTISATKTLYDSGALGTVSGAGNPTSIQQLKTSAPVAWANPSTTTFDAYGRVLSSHDPLNRTSSTTYGANAASQKYLPVVTKATNSAGWVSSTLLDPGRQLPTVATDVNGRLVTKTYDSLGRLTQVWLANHPASAYSSLPSIKYAYQMTNSSAVATTTSTLVDGNLYKIDIKIGDALLQPRQEQETTADWQSSARLITNTAYDTHGWVTSVDPAFYNEGGAPSTTPTSVAYSADIPAETRTSYDGQGRAVSSEMWSNGHYSWRTATTYDGANRTTITPPSGGISTVALTDSRGQRVSLEQDPGGPNDNITSYRYDAAGRRALIVGPLSPGSAISGSPLTWTSRYDALGNVLRTVEPDAGITVNTYNDDSELTASTTTGNEPGSTSKTLTFDHSDALGRLVAEHADSGTGPLVSTYTYDTPHGRGQIASSSSYNAAGTKTFTKTISDYTALNQPTAVTMSIPAGIFGAASPGISYTSTFTYSPVGGLTKHQAIEETGASGLMPDEDYAISYNTYGLPAASGGLNSYVTSTNYDHHGRLTRTVMGAIPDQVALTNSWDPATDRLRNSSVSVEDGVTAVNDVDYTYNPAGQITSIRDAEGADASSTDQQCFRYDSLNRLVDAWTDGVGTSGNLGDGAVGQCVTGDPNAAGTTFTGPAPYWQSYAYDLTGNRIGRTDHAVSAASTTISAAQDFTGTGDAHAAHKMTTGGQVDTYTYDRGKPSSRSTTVGGVASGDQAIAYQWNPQGKLSSLTQGTTTSPKMVTSTYLYDADGSQISEADATTTASAGGVPASTSTSTTLHLGTDTISLVDGAVVKVQRQYAFDGGPTAVRTATTGSSATSTDAVHYEIADPHGTALTDVGADSLTVSRGAYTPFGEVRGTVPSAFATGSSRGFLNAPTNAGTGLTAVGAREYSAASGRFLTPDPIVNSSDPQSLNSYAYADNDPENQTDPTGLMLVHGGDDCSGSRCEGESGGTTSTGGATGSTADAPAPKRSGGNYTGLHNRVAADALVTVTSQAIALGWTVVDARTEFIINNASKKCKGDFENCPNAGRADVVLLVQAADGEQRYYIWEVKKYTIGATQANKEANDYAIALNRKNGPAGPGAYVGWDIGGPYTGNASGKDTEYWGGKRGAVLYGKSGGKKALDPAAKQARQDAQASGALETFDTSSYKYDDYRAPAGGPPAPAPEPDDSFTPYYDPSQGCMNSDICGGGAAHGG